jgi:hypothetical protein
MRYYFPNPYGKEVIMRDKSPLKWLCLLLLILFIFPSVILAEKKGKSLVGEETLYFSLPSTHDRLITYLSEYYGKYHLIITFFPAAFTPV